MNTRTLQPVILCMLVCLLFPNLASAQMFSVQEEQRQQRVRPISQIYIGWEPTDFSYFGPAQTDFQRTSYEMDSPIFRIRYETFGTELFLGYGDDLTGADSVDFFHIGGRFGRPVPLHRSKKIRVNIPIQIQADLTSASNEFFVGDKFQQSNILIGAGLSAGVSLSPKVRWETSMIPSFGYSLSPGGTFGGVTYQLDGQTRLSFLELFGSVGLSIGYDYTYKKFDISVNRFDYNLQSHSFLVGVNF